MSTITTEFTPGPYVAAEWDCDPRINEDGNRYWGIKPKTFAFDANYLDASGWMTEANANLLAAAPELYEELVEARTTLSILRTQVMVEIGRCADPSESRWEGVPEKLKERIDAVDAALAKARGEG